VAHRVCFFVIERAGRGYTLFVARSHTSEIHQPTGRAAYRAGPEIERELAKERSVTISGGRYRATVARAGSTYEAWTESLPFVYGRQAPSLQGALDSIEERYRVEVEGDEQKST
jgi:hypothetical protein